jgi:hypothetical protein
MQLISPEFLIYMLNSQKVSLINKKMFIELLISTYINHYKLETLSDQLIPDILVWSDHEYERTYDYQIMKEE